MTTTADPLLEATQNLVLQAKETLAAAQNIHTIAQDTVNATGGADLASTSPFVMGLTVFVLAVFVGYYVVWRVTPALHSPLLAVTNAISSVIIVGGIMAAGLPMLGYAKQFGFLAVTAASINIFGGFFITYRMLKMFQQKNKEASS